MKKVFTIIIIASLALSSCVVNEKSLRKIKYSFQSGINKGGITENTDLGVLSNSLDENYIDAYSGATQIGVNISVKANKPLKNGEIESGLEYMFNSQTFSFYDQANMFVGVRDLKVNQFMLPITYNFNLLKKALPEAELQLKLGFMGQFNLITSHEIGTLPDYSINPYSGGALFGISFYPIRFANNTKLGFYIDAYRGSQIYEDYYNQNAFEMPGSSFIKGGIRYRFY